MITINPQDARHSKQMITEKEERKENRDLPLKCSWRRILCKQKKQTNKNTQKKAFLVLSFEFAIAPVIRRVDQRQ